MQNILGFRDSLLKDGINRLQELYDSVPGEKEEIDFKQDLLEELNFYLELHYNISLDVVCYSIMRNLYENPTANDISDQWKCILKNDWLFEKAMICIDKTALKLEFMKKENRITTYPKPLFLKGDD